jgi:uncharacterized protein (TIGR03435 family)
MGTRKTVIFAMTLASIALQSTIYAQAAPAFEVTPVIASSPAFATGPIRVSRTPQRIALDRARVGDIIAFAYDLPFDRIERQPQWMYDDAFDVSVTTADATDLPEQKLLLQKLLEERFGLVVHRISNQSPVYFLVAGANVNLTPAKETGAVDIPQFRPVPGVLLLSPNGVGLTDAASHASMSDLAAWLSRQVQLPVLDKTGITGYYDIEISGLPLRGGSEGTIRAVQTSLGLNLELHPGTAESLIIDQSTRPNAK